MKMNSKGIGAITSDERTVRGFAPSEATAEWSKSLSEAARLDPGKLLILRSRTKPEIKACDSVLVVLAAGKGTRFGSQPKCIQPVLGKPIARHSIDAFRTISPAPAVVVIGYEHEQVAAALGPDNIFVISDNPAGGTAFATYEAFSESALLAANPVVVVSMGDRIVPAAILRRLLELHSLGGREAGLSFLTARYEPPRHQGKGRVLRDAAGQVVRIVEQKDIITEREPLTQQALESLTEGNCPLYAIRAATLFRHLRRLTNANAQHQYYLTDIVAAISGDGAEIRTLTTSPNDPEYDLLCSDVTRPQDLALLEGVLSRQAALAARNEVARAVETLQAARPRGQVASIARQLQELFVAATREKFGYRPDQPAAIGVSGGRLRIAFMHPDMSRFFGPAWQMPIGASDASGSEQIVVVAQATTDRRIHLHPLDPKYREPVDSVSADEECMYPGTEIADWHSYEGFGTRMSETLLLSLGYFSDEEVQTRVSRNLPLPPLSLRVSNSMRRPFALVGNAIGSMRTLRAGYLGAKVQTVLGREYFAGLRIACTGGIPQGGFSSSSALTVATKNALNSLFDLGIPPDLLVHLACQAEYGTGVRAGSLDQATEQKGKPGEGTLISSNPADNYRVLGTYRVPTERFRVIFPYTFERDRAAWRWSWGVYAERPVSGGPLTTGEIRKLTGKAAEIAAILTRQPNDTDFFRAIEPDLIEDGRLNLEARRWICGILLQLPLLVSRDELQRRIAAQREWVIEDLLRTHAINRESAKAHTEALFGSLFSGWREPVLRRSLILTDRSCGDGQSEINRHRRLNERSSTLYVRPTSVTETGVPLRAMVAYLFSEVAKNFHLIHHAEEWIECVSRSQDGDRCAAIDPTRLPNRSTMEAEIEWEQGLTGPSLLEAWLERYGATHYDFNQGLDDATLSRSVPPDFHCAPGGSFFRGIALIDLADAMVKRAFGADSVAVRVNAAGQGDYFQVHIDTSKSPVGEVKNFLRKAFYRRFGLSPDPEFVETSPGGGAIGVSLSRFDLLPELVHALQENDVPTR